jgi:hypothetical protein
MDRDELDERIRTRRPGEIGLRRGIPLEDDQHRAQAGGSHVPFVPEPEDAMAAREEEPEAQPPNVDHTAPGFDARTSVPLPPAEPPTPEPAAPASDEARYEDSPPYLDESRDVGGGYVEGPYGEQPYGAPEDAYPTTYVYADAGGGRRRRGGGALPIIGFILLCVLALGVGAALAGVLGGGGIGQASSTPSAFASQAASTEPSLAPTETPSDQSSATPEPTDGPITFPDGTEITVQPCATQEMSFDGCAEDGSVISEPTMWVWIGFKDAHASDTFVLALRSQGQTINQQEQELGSILDCERNGEPICSGYLIGAAYRDLQAGEYQLVVRRGEDFADSASFTVEN